MKFHLINILLNVLVLQSFGTASAMVSADNINSFNSTYENGSSSTVSAHRRAAESSLSDDTGTILSTRGPYSHCYLRFGQIQCWGILAGENTRQPDVIDISSFNSDPVAIATSNFACALTYDSHIFCWGTGHDHGQYGEGDHEGFGPHKLRLNNNGVLEDVANVVDFSLGSVHGCVVFPDQSMTCWGYNNNGESTSINGLYDGSTPDKKVKFLSCALYYTCVVTEDNVIKCHGRESETGPGGFISYQPTYTITKFEAGSWGNNCYLIDKEPELGLNMECFGHNHNGEMGAGFFSGQSNLATPVSPTFPQNSVISSFSVGIHGACAILESDNSQWCWGRNEYSHLGVAGNYTKFNTPQQVITTNHLDQTLISAVRIAGRAGFALLKDGSVYSWGTNSRYGDLGIGSYDDELIITGYGSAVKVLLLEVTQPPVEVIAPSLTPSLMPSVSTSQPSFVPSSIPSEKPSNNPSVIPSLFPTVSLQPTLDSFSWDIKLDTPGFLKTPLIEDGVQEFITAYNISDRDYGIEVFKNDCSTPSSDLTLTTTVDSKSSSQNHLEAAFLYNQTVIQSSNLWTGNSTGGEANFCVKLSLYSNSTSGALINFIETKYKIEVDLTTGFSTTVNVNRTVAGDGGVKRIDIDENITIYQCNDSFDELTLPPPLAQGDALQLCVMTENDSLFEVGKIEDVTIRQNGTKAFHYVTSFVDSYWAVSSCMAINTIASKCKIKIQLMGVYFSDADPTDITVSGSVKLDYLGRRRLGDVGGDHGMDKMRRHLLDKDEVTGSEGAMFSFDVSLTSKHDVELQESDNYSSGSVHGSSIVFVLMSVVAIMISA